MTPAIVIVTFNRPKALTRLLTSIENSRINNENVDLVISIDFENSDTHTQVVKIAEDFCWLKGKKEIIQFKENQGLRKHIITCGQLTKKYEAIILLEDDIYVSPQFYNYALQTLARYDENVEISGISLYSHRKNIHNNRPFEPINGGRDIFFMQLSQSWGQCWSKYMWECFYAWYQIYKDENFQNDLRIPKFVRNWPEKSWLKYHIIYTIVENKFFIYPYTSYTTNFGDVGSNFKKGGINNETQVPLQINSKKLQFPEINTEIRYDAYFENIDLLKSEFSDLCVDLYGLKFNDSNNRFWITSRQLNYAIINSYGLNFKPHDLNIILKNKGKFFFLYDTKAIKKNRDSKEKVFNTFQYDYQFLKVDIIIKYLFFRIKQYLKKGSN